MRSRSLEKVQNRPRGPEKAGKRHRLTKASEEALEKAQKRLRGPEKIDKRPEAKKPRKGLGRGPEAHKRLRRGPGL